MQFHNSGIALAVLATLAGGAAAQSQVTVFGSFDAAVRHQTNTAPTNAAGSQISGTPQGTLNSLEGKSVANASRLGFKGTEELGDGNQAHFLLESGFDGDTGMQNDANSLFNRQLYVGLRGPWGNLDLGRQYSASYKTLVAYDPFAGAYQITSVAAPGSGNVGGCFPVTAGCVRFNNDAQYTKVVGGLTVRVEVALGETAGDSRTGTSKTLGAVYVTGPLTVGAAYMRQDTPAVPTTATYPGTPANAARSNYTVGAAYAQGGLRLAAGRVLDRTATIGGDSTFEQTWAGASWLALPQVKLTGAWYHHALRGPAGTGAGALRVTGPDGRAGWDVQLLEARYLLSRRTSVYATIGHQKWSKGIQFLPTAANGGVTQNSLYLGISHQF
ncbi:MAG: porin [Pseudomonadota bacterium]